VVVVLCHEPSNALAGSAAELSPGRQIVDLTVQSRARRGCRGRYCWPTARRRRRRPSGAHGRWPCLRGTTDASRPLRVARRRSRLTLVLHESFGPGRGSLPRPLATNGQQLDLGSIVLDATTRRSSRSPRRRTRSTCLWRARSWCISAKPIDPNSDCGNLVELRRWTAPASPPPTPGRTPGDAAHRPAAAACLNATTYRVKVTNRVYRPGRRPPQASRCSRPSAPPTCWPPVVIQVTPRRRAAGAARRADPRRLHEPVDAPSLSGSHLQLTTSRTGAGVTSHSSPLTGDRELLVQPRRRGSSQSHAYQLTVVAESDKVGNTWRRHPFVTTFL